ncbi:hypothetical protein BN439_3340 [Erwinia amylovora Ea644]|nr:hypothetical protein BN439_3340 [Erwinia amylovora Ea644]
MQHRFANRLQSVIATEIYTYHHHAILHHQR